MKHEFNPHNIHLILGLGNPGTEYQNTYHNVGILFLETFLKQTKEQKTFTTISRKKFMRVVVNKKIVIKPETFMNESGIATKNALQYEKIKIEEMIIVHDDNDIPLGSFKIDFDRGAAGHNGIHSIIKTLNTKKFWRLRIGIQKKTPIGKKKAGDFVLAKISPTDKKEILRACQNACELFRSEECFNIN